LADDERLEFVLVTMRVRDRYPDRLMHRCGAEVAGGRELGSYADHVGGQRRCKRTSHRAYFDAE
jgi:hypothetical protein